MKKQLYSLLVLSAYCLAGFSQSQTRTATYLNNLNNFHASYGDLNFPRANAQDVAADDNIFTCSAKMAGLKDPTSSRRPNSTSTLAL